MHPVNLITSLGLASTNLAKRVRTWGLYVRGMCIGYAEIPVTRQPQYVTVKANTKSEARALFKRYFRFGRLPTGLTRRGDLVEMTGQ